MIIKEPNRFSFIKGVPLSYTELVSFKKGILLKYKKLVPVCVKIESLQFSF